MGLRRRSLGIWGSLVQHAIWHVERLRIPTINFLYLLPSSSHSLILSFEWKSSARFTEPSGVFTSTFKKHLSRAAPVPKYVSSSTIFTAFTIALIRQLYSFFHSS